MNCIYLTREELTFMRLDQLCKIDLRAFFSAHKRTILFIKDRFDNILGYLNHQSYYKSKTAEEGIQKFHYSLDVSELFLFNKEAFLKSNSDVIPILDDHQFVGAIIGSYPEELASFDRLIYQMALSVITVFKDDLLSYFKLNSISSISFKGNLEDFCLLRYTFPEIIWLHSASDEEVDLTIDSLYSKSYRRPKNETPIMSLEELLTLALIPVLKKYLDYRNVSICFVEGPILEKLKNVQSHSLSHLIGTTLEVALSDDKALIEFANGDKSILTHFQNLGNSDSIFFNGINLTMSEPNRGRAEIRKRQVHLYGPCLAYGTCVPVEYSISELMETGIGNNSISVVNHGIRCGHSVLNDILSIFSTPFQDGDFVVLLDAFSDSIHNEISKSYDIFDLSNVLNEFDGACWFFLDNPFHINHIGNKLFAEALCQLICPYIARMELPHKDKASFFDEVQRINKVDTNRLLEKGLLGTYIEYVKSHRKYTTPEDIVGAVLLTANPITKGHEYLISYAKSKCNILYVFIVEEDAFFFSTVERIFLTHQVVKDPNIVVLLTGTLMTAKFTFPEYFTKDNNKIEESNLEISNLHCEIFGRCICPILGITKRFVGEEIEGSVTDAYNKKLMTILPTFGVDVEIIPRKVDKNTTTISSSSVREMIRMREYDNLNSFVSPTVANYILNKWHPEN